MTIHTTLPRITRVVLRLPAGLSVREALAAQIEALIDRLDAMDPDPDLEENGDLEPSIGTCHQGVVDAEFDPSDDEPSLGAPECVAQGAWSQCQRGPDLEEDVRVPGKPRRKLRGYPGEIFHIERAEKARIAGELRAILGRHVTDGVTRHDIMTRGSCCHMPTTGSAVRP